MDNLLELIGRRLTRAQYVGVLGQEYHLSRNAPINLRCAADHVEPTHPDLASWLRKHAGDEDGHHEWAAQDLADLGEAIPPPTPATGRLLQVVRQVATSDHAYRILGLSTIVEHLAPRIDPDALLPEGVGQARRFVARHTVVDVAHAAEVDQAIGELSQAHQGEVLEQAIEFGRLFSQFLVEAAMSVPEPANDTVALAAQGAHS